MQDTECRSVRKLQTILGCATWVNFLNTVEKAKIACEGAGEHVQNHFADVGQMVEIGSQRRIVDIALTRGTSAAKLYVIHCTHHKEQLVVTCNL